MTDVRVVTSERIFPAVEISTVKRRGPKVEGRRKFRVAAISHSGDFRRAHGQTRTSTDGHGHTRRICVGLFEMRAVNSSKGGTATGQFHIAISGVTVRFGYCVGVKSTLPKKAPLEDLRSIRI